MESITVYHNPRCSKSRQTVELLEAKGVSFSLFEYLERGPDADAVRQVMRCLGIDDPRQMMRTKEAEYAERNLASAGPADLIAAMVECPKLIERPIVIQGERAIIARPPELVHEFVT